MLLYGRLAVKRWRHELPLWQERPTFRHAGAIDAARERTFVHWGRSRP